MTPIEGFCSRHGSIAVPSLSAFKHWKCDSVLIICLFAGKPELNNDYVLKLSKRISSDWERLAGILGFSKIRIIIFRYQSKKKEKQCCHMLGAWLKKQKSNEEATTTLREALKEIGCNDLAVKLSGKNCSYFARIMTMITSFLIPLQHANRSVSQTTVA